ncbi:hypothetical protein O7632_12730 [Solwaraspora sp. WMMD406]|uniref:hypothetical protein n=1 Tax=Solwaraspora sp. WMMD406 TaxID=3016095 RepID=UPI0024180A3B|nr:hypothetical protein [Solwaraspora sp. WMMD406]MDG4764956.1 hypothetical protein [Solwaraspora sp. WMMD406]
MTIRDPRRAARQAVRRRAVLLCAAALLGLLTVAPPVPAPAGAVPIETVGAGATTPAGAPSADAATSETGSAETVRGRAEGPEDFTGLEITVSRTRDLTNQAIVVTWTGGAPTPRNRQLGVDYLQVMQCWGDPDDPADPDGLAFRETCQFGLGLPQPKMAQGADAPTSKNASRRRVDPFDVAGYPDRDPAEPLAADAQMVPFRTVDGERTPDGSPDQPFGSKPNPAVPGGVMDRTDDDVLRTYFDEASTNEYPYALTAADGTGRIAFEVQNAGRAPHLGCGASVGTGGGVRDCHLVIVPRGRHNPYTGDDVSASGAVHGSPFTPAVWRHRIVVPLRFRPVGAVCPLTQAERRTAGTEMIAEAVTSWQPAVCADDGPVIGYSAIGDFEAEAQILSESAAAPGLVFTSAPIETPAGADPLVSAPVAASGVVIAYNVDGNLDPYASAGESERLRGAVLADLKLTPRLVAKLLTQSYRRDVPGVGGPEGNPNSVKYDREFIDLNPVFEHWDKTPSATLNGLMVPVGNAMATRELWRWVLTDAAARRWLAGEPDEQGMVVNPAYQQVLAGQSAPDYFPKADPGCATETFLDVEYANCTLDYRPYTGTLGEGALQALRADTKGATVPLQTINLPAGEQPKWTRIPRQEPGFRMAMAVTDSASAARYGLHTAQLCHSSVTPDGGHTATDCRSATEAQLGTALDAMVPSTVEGVRAIDPAAVWARPQAYPLTMVSYAVADTSAPADARRDYAGLLRHAAGPGQTPGVEPGTLPEGYVPLPAAWREQTRAAADLLERYVAPTTPAPTPGPTPLPF